MRYFLFLLFATFSFGQQSLDVDFISMNGRITLNENEKSVLGVITYEFNVIKPTDTIRIDGQKMEFLAVLINGKDVKYLNTGSQLVVVNNFKLGLNTITINYYGYPKKALYFIGKDDDLQIWTQGQGKYTSNWLPSFDDVNEKVIFNLSILFRNDFEVISNGKLASVENVFNGKLKLWNYQMQQPMSSYLVMIAIGKFDKTVIKSKSGIPIELYLKPADKNKFETTYKHSKKIFDFLEQEIGVKYPWKIYRQIPIFDFLYGGMENTTSTLFSQDYVVDEMGFNDENYINVNAHELAHQWFGNLITAKSGKDHWLQEGFATYYALLAEKQLYGEHYFFSKLISYYEEIKDQWQDNIPILNATASSTTFYKKGALALHVLRTDVGKTKFDLAIKNYLIKYRFKNVDTDDFLAEIKKVSNYDIENFKKTYLETSKNDNLYLNYLKKWNQYQFIEQIENANDKNKTAIYTAILQNQKIQPLIKNKIFTRLIGYDFKDKKQFIDIALKDKQLQVQKDLLHAISNYPPEYYTKILQIFNKPSYKIKEDFLTNANVSQANLFKLLNELESISTQNTILRIYWLKISIFLEKYQRTRKKEFINEINSFTSDKYSVNVRLIAFNSVSILMPEYESSLKNLFLATNHHNWHLVKLAKESISEILYNSSNRDYIIQFQKISTPEIQVIIQKYLDKSKIN